MLKQDTCGRFLKTMFVAGAVLVAYTLAFELLPAQAFSEGTDQAHDFSDGFYRQNGLNPKSPDFRRRFAAHDGITSVETHTTDPTRNKTRILPVNCGYDAAGSVLCYPGPPVFFGEKSFQNNAAGDRARELAEFRAFIFPKADGDPLSPAPPNRRQDNLFETTKGYVGVNPLGLWRLTFVSYTDAAFTPAGQAVLAPLHVQNGTDLDGTPIVKRLHVLLELEAEGLVEFKTRPIEEGSEPWVV